MDEASSEQTTKAQSSGPLRWERRAGGRLGFSLYNAFWRKSGKEGIIKCLPSVLKKHVSAFSGHTSIDHSHTSSPHGSVPNLLHQPSMRQQLHPPEVNYPMQWQTFLFACWTCVWRHWRHRLFNFCRAILAENVESASSWPPLWTSKRFLRIEHVLWAWKPLGNIPFLLQLFTLNHLKPTI